MNLACIALAFYCGNTSALEVTGAGSTFVFPLVAKWAARYRDVSGDTVNYQSLGSGGGIQQIKRNVVEFGATDMPLKSEELRAEKLVQFPIVAGAVVPVVHVAGLNDGDLKLTGVLLADIFLGRIRRWDDRRLVDLNPDLKLPSRLITVVHRADGSGTSYIWTSFLNQASAAWRSGPGAATALKWPTGVGAKGNEGVASFVKQIDGAIGYVESAFAIKARMTTARLENRAGEFVRATQPSFSAALKGIDWSRSPDYDVSLINAAGETSWPITGATFVLMRKSPRDAESAGAALRFFKWAFANGGEDAGALHYVPLPEPLRERVVAEWPTRFKL